ncbi:hypothetical protein PWY87_17525 [Kribbella solani]|uniref:hypothetical protein n=1 Tax=Kribbella solani TaxID=236067 RepID=UPI0029B36663|nr:hypothetical protein [Kribbella solani]MDX3003491.1 hypothetical protein [Kribbella solani]
MGLVILVWRNSPVEDMHAGRRGPDDAAMFATSTELQAAAAKALRKDNRAWGLLDFEDYLLDRDRPWPATAGRNLQDLGYGYLGAYQRHVKDQINVLIGLSKHACVEEPLVTYLIPRALMYGRFHKGMPGWDLIVDRIGLLLSDPRHPGWRDPNYGDEAVRDMPRGLSIDDLQHALRSRPSSLPDEVLTWLSDHFLYCAAPPYSGSFN